MHAGIVWCVNPPTHEVIIQGYCQGANRKQKPDDKSRLVYLKFACMHILDACTVFRDILYS